jgi:hypothetical protein
VTHPVLAIGWEKKDSGPGDSGGRKENLKFHNQLGVCMGRLERRFRTLTLRSRLRGILPPFESAL